MTIPTIPPVPDGMRPLPPGDAGRIGALTRLIWIADEDMPRDASGRVKDADARVDPRTGSTVILVRRGLDPAIQRVRVAKLRRAIRAHAGVSRPAAWVMVATDGLRRFGLGWWRMQASAAGQHAISSVSQHATEAAIGVVAVATVTTGAIIASRDSGPHAPAVGSPAWHRLHPVHVTLPPRPLSYLGAYEPSSPASYTGMETFAATCGRQPNVALYYSGWFEKFQAAFAMRAAAHGAIPLVQMNPEIDPGGAPISLAAIASGTYDSYLVSYADQVASYGRAVIIGFGHEMNGDWYPWGWEHQSPEEFVSAWQHVVNVFRRQGADNVTWLWTVNKVAGKTGPLGDYWPGRDYVTWVGIDGYYQRPDDTWSSVFTPTITQIRRFTTAPLLIAETAIGPVGTEPWQLNDMFASIRQNGYLGLVWFDENKSAYLSYRLEGDPKDTAVFRQETATWRRLVHQRGAK